MSLFWMSALVVYQFVVIEAVGKCHFVSGTVGPSKSTSRQPTALRSVDAPVSLEQAQRQRVSAALPQTLRVSRAPRDRTNISKKREHVLNQGLPGGATRSAISRIFEVTRIFPLARKGTQRQVNSRADRCTARKNGASVSTVVSPIGQFPERTRLMRAPFGGRIPEEWRDGRTLPRHVQTSLPTHARG